MKKLKIILSYIFTFGIVYFVLKNKAKKRAKNFNNELTISTKLPFRLDNFLNEIGGINNIKSLSSTINTIKIQLNDKSKFNENALKVVKAKGVMWGSNDTLTIILGDFSIELEKQIKNLMN